jgi:hypothetical protein
MDSPRNITPGSAAARADGRTDPPGEVAERLNAPVSKTGMGDSSIGGSNPPLSVKCREGRQLSVWRRPGPAPGNDGTRSRLRYF